MKLTAAVSLVFLALNVPSFGRTIVDPPPLKVRFACGVVKFMDSIVPDAELSLSQERSGEALSHAKTDVNGRSQFSSVRPGRYWIAATIPKIGAVHVPVRVKSGKQATKCNGIELNLILNSSCPLHFNYAKYKE